MSNDQVKRGLVLGGGGLLGAAWMVGALTAVEEHTGHDVRGFDYIVGTSAGAVLAGLLGAGVDAPTIRNHQLGRTDGGALAGHQWDYDTATGGSKPPRPRLRVGSPSLVTRNVRRLRRMPPLTVLSALAPVGRGSLQNVGDLIAAVVPDGDWAPRAGIWVVALNYETGRRVPFGRPGEPSTGLAQAVMASCAIPGWFAPMTIDGQRYVDGGTWSVTSADLLVGLGLDEVYIVAPMVSFELDHPTTLLTRVERRWRARVTARCMREASRLRMEGTQVTVLGPGPEDLVEMGANVMDSSRRLSVLETSMRTSAQALTSSPAPTTSGGT